MLAMVNDAAVIVVVILFALYIFPEVRLLNNMVVLFLNFWGI